MAIAKVENYNGAPALIIDGKPYPPMYATIRTINGEEMVIDEEYYKKLGEAGSCGSKAELSLGTVLGFAEV